jgi:hypothetical protein
MRSRCGMVANRRRFAALVDPRICPESVGFSQERTIAPGRTNGWGRVEVRILVAGAACDRPGACRGFSKSGVARAVGMPARAHNFRLVCNAFAVGAAIL